MSYFYNVLENSYSRSLDFLATSARSTKGIKKISKALMKSSELIDRLAGENYFPQIGKLYEALKSCKTFIGSSDILSRLNYWGSSERKKSKPLKLFTELFRTAKDGCKTLKFAASANLIRLGEYAQYTARIPFLGVAIHFNLTLFKNYFQVLTSLFELLDAEQNVSDNNQAINRCEDKFKVWEERKKAVQEVLEATTRGISIENPVVEGYRQQLLRYHTFRVFAVTDVVYQNDVGRLFGQKTQAPEPKRKVAQRLNDEQLESICRELQKSGIELENLQNSCTQYEEYEAKLRANPGIVQQFLDGLHTVMEEYRGFVFDPTKRPNDKLKYAAECAVSHIRKQKKWLGKPAETNQADVTNKLPAQEEVEKHLMMQSALELQNQDDLKNLVQEYTYKVEKWRAKLVNISKKNRVLEISMVDNTIRLFNCALTAGFALLGIASGPGVAALGLISSGMGLYRFYNESKNAPSPLPKRSDYLPKDSFKETPGAQ